MFRDVKQKAFKYCNMFLGMQNPHYTEFHKKKGIGKNYDADLYSDDGWSNRVWQLEKHILKEILSHEKKLEIMDFAAGTGRISQYLEELKIGSIVAVDTSEDMLSVAKKKLKKTKIVCSDITKGCSSSELNKKFDLILAFRFFLNIDNNLRKSVMKKLGQMIKKDGKLIFNVHSNKHSIMSLKNIFRDRMNTLSVSDVEKLLKCGGFKVQKIYSYGFIPHWKKRQILPFDKWIGIEKKLITNKFLFGTHLTFVCEKEK